MTFFRNSIKELWSTEIIVPEYTFRYGYKFFIVILL